MLKKLLKALCLVWITTLPALAQGIQSPAEFLGYEIGTKFTFHHRVIDYFEYVAQKAPDRVKLVSYGKTPEGRPLLVAFVAKPAYMSKLEEIRTNNLKSIGLLPGKPSGPVPAIAWMSYNIHGNEAISSEASMLVLFEMLNPANKLTQKVIENTVVAIDPCLNPDGFDRYVQGYSRYVSKTPDFNLASIEHNEPWPGGRFNHYLFDLNRDWAWQTQTESQQRMALYNSWMPHLHGDFHEMGPGSTYYFPPSARPYHENLTSWQRQFQQMLGDYNKKQFDQRGWLYFTKENFDLLYPSYGDTYPSYNGAIGMTFEQGGSGHAGINYIREDGDTLTLAMRIEHHFAATMGTLEAISSNADKTVAEFVKYFEEPTQKGAGKYKSYVIKTANEPSKTQALAQQLDKLQIQYKYADKASTGTGFSYLSRKEESFRVEPNDMIVSTYQPKGTFAKILLEPATMLEDSNTYDITAWALPYAFGLSAYATTAKLEGSTTQYLKPSQPAINQTEPVYAYLVPWNSFEAVKFVAELHQHKIVARMHEMPFEIDGKSYDHGTLVITRAANAYMGKGFDEKVQSAAKKSGVILHPVYTGMVSKGLDLGSNSVFTLKVPKVGLILGEGVSPTAAGSVWHYFENELGYPLTLIDGSYAARTDLSTFNTLILAEGRYNTIFRDTKMIQDWVSKGGKLIALEGATRFFADREGFSLTSKKEGKSEDNPLQAYADRERAGISEQIPGAIYKIYMDATHPLGYGYKNGYYTLIKDVFGFDYLKNGWNVGYVKEDSYVTGFVGSKAKSKINNSLLAGVESVGRGKVIYLMDEPIFRGFWHTGKLLFGSAVFVVK